MQTNVIGLLRNEGTDPIIDELENRLGKLGYATARYPIRVDEKLGLRRQNVPSGLMDAINARHFLTFAGKDLSYQVLAKYSIYTKAEGVRWISVDSSDGGNLSWKDAREAMGPLHMGYLGADSVFANSLDNTELQKSIEEMSGQMHLPKDYFRNPTKVKLPKQDKKTVYLFRYGLGDTAYEDSLVFRANRVCEENHLPHPNMVTKIALDSGNCYVFRDTESPPEKSIDYYSNFDLRAPIFNGGPLTDSMDIFYAMKYTSLVFYEDDKRVKTFIKEVQKMHRGEATFKDLTPKWWQYI